MGGRKETCAPIIDLQWKKIHLCLPDFLDPITPILVLLQAQGPNKERGGRQQSWKWSKNRRGGAAAVSALSPSCLEPWCCSLYFRLTRVFGAFWIKEPFPRYCFAASSSGPPGDALFLSRYRYGLRRPGTSRPRNIGSKWATHLTGDWYIHLRTPGVFVTAKHYGLKRTLSATTSGFMARVAVDAPVLAWRCQTRYQRNSESIDLRCVVKLLLFPRKYLNGESYGTTKFPHALINNGNSTSPPNAHPKLRHASITIRDWLPNCGLARRHSPPNTGTMTTTLPASNAWLALRELERLPLMSFVVYSSVHCIFVLKFQPSQRRMPKWLILLGHHSSKGLTFQCWNSCIFPGNTPSCLSSLVVVLLSIYSHLSWLVLTLMFFKSESSNISMIRVSQWNHLHKVSISKDYLLSLPLRRCLGTFHMVRLYFDWCRRILFSIRTRHIMQQWPKRALFSSECPTTVLTKIVARWKARCPLRCVKSLSDFHILITLPGCDITGTWKGIHQSLLRALWYMIQTVITESAGLGWSWKLLVSLFYNRIYANYSLR